MNRRLPLVLVLCFVAVSLRAADDVARLHALFDRVWETNLR